MIVPPRAGTAMVRGVRMACIGAGIWQGGPLRRPPSARRFSVETLWQAHNAVYAVPRVP